MKDAILIVVVVLLVALLLGAILGPGRLPWLSTPTPEPTKTQADPTATPVPEAGEVYLQIDAAKIDPLASTLQTGLAQFVSVEKLASPAVYVGPEPATEGAPGGAEVAAPAHGAITVDVEVIAFVDGAGDHSLTYDEENTARVLVRLPATQVADVARGLAGAVEQGVWLVAVQVETGGGEEE